MTKSRYSFLLYVFYLIVVCSIGVEFIGSLLFITDGNSLYLKKERLFVEDKELGYTLKPGFKINGTENKLYPGVSLSIGSHGFRMPEYDDRPKIVLVGDSVAFGFGLSYEDTISYQLERMLEGKYQVVNAGVPGYNIRQWQSMGMRLENNLKPKVIVALVNANDFETRYYPIRGGATVTRTKSYPWDATLIEESNIPHEELNYSIVKWLTKHLFDSQLALNGIKASPRAINDDYESVYKGELKCIEFYNSGSYHAKEKFEDAVAAMREFSNQVTAGKASVIFAFLPYRVSAARPDIGMDKRFSDLEGRVNTGPKIGTVKLQNLLNDNKHFLPSDSHTSKLGNSIIAKALAEKIQRMVVQASN